MRMTTILLNGLHPVPKTPSCFDGAGGGSWADDTREFKLEAVELIRDGGVSYAQASQYLGVHPTQLRNWVKAYQNSWAQGVISTESCPLDDETVIKHLEAANHSQENWQEAVDVLHKRILSLTFPRAIRLLRIVDTLSQSTVGTVGRRPRRRSRLRFNRSVVRVRRAH